MNGGAAGRFRPKSSNSQRSRGSQYDTSSVSDLHNAGSIQDQEECSRLIHEFNSQVASYRDLLMVVGDKTDTPALRENITKVRRKGIDCAKIAKYRLTPYVSSKSPMAEFQSQLIQLTGCLELFVNEMKRSYSLIRAFPMRADFDNIPGVLSATGSQIAMATMGAMGSNLFTADAMASFPENCDESYVCEMPLINREELLSIQSDIQDIKEMITDIDGIVPRPKTPDEDMFLPELLSAGTRHHFPERHRRINLCCICVQESL
ncbi:regulator of G-protein signaling 7-binding protein A-like [Glandiceps talaboti]